jgi:hypothetical protein
LEFGASGTGCQYKNLSVNFEREIPYPHTKNERCTHFDSKRKNSRFSRCVKRLTFEGGETS